MKERLDVLLVKKGFFDNRTRAKAAIMEGRVYIGGRIYDKAGTMVKEDSEIELKGDDCPYVGRGGYKLQKALDTFVIDLRGCVAMDIGASTGGFTDCMLQRGAVKVYSVDVGYGQLDYKLRMDDRVVNMEKVNFRYFTPDMIDDKLDFASVDVSFISLSMILPAAAPLLKDKACMVCLIKPQFEAGREQVGRGGIVKDPAVHVEVIQKAVGFAQDNGFVLYGLTYSPVTGAKGNIEYLMMIETAAAAADEGIADPSDEDLQALAERVVREAHENFDK
ncbi:MAG: TlyA family RNA methyltransferase [Anaerovoracaceae bacterium]|nr:TlyA family RNA methyltransferase [Bacillota bacterium]MDY2670076.1 TlyA family RNA methyltransferase [Anaerovoracaceae bacterium]